VQDFGGTALRKGDTVRLRRRWEDGIKMHLTETDWGVDWIHLAQNRDQWRTVVDTVMNLHVLAQRGFYLFS
jgi:hypothetical protein